VTQSGILRGFEGLVSSIISGGLGIGVGAGWNRRERVALVGGVCDVWMLLGSVGISLLSLVCSVRVRVRNGGGL